MGNPTQQEADEFFSRTKKELDERRAEDDVIKVLIANGELEQHPEILEGAIQRSRSHLERSKEEVAKWETP